MEKSNDTQTAAKVELNKHTEEQKVYNARI